MTLESNTRLKEAEEAVVLNTGLRLMGNMMWFVGDQFYNVPPRQLTKAERILWKALVELTEEHM